VARVDVGGFSLAFDTAGSGPALVLLHGLGGSRATFRPVLAPLAERFRVIAPDIRGHGESDTPGGEWTTADVARDVPRLLSALGIARAHLVGFSVGGVLAMELAATDATTIETLVLASTASEGNRRAGDHYLELADKAEREGGEAVRNAFIEDLPEVTAPDGTGFAKLARCMARLAVEPITPRLCRIRCPVLILAGERDFLGPKAPAILAREMPHAKLEIVAGAGHALHLEQPERFVQTIVDFAGGAR
jgi:pimeloyl-ACP methyl ester carboxylesterase